jgi:hypothetical protein
MIDKTELYFKLAEFHGLRAAVSVQCGLVGYSYSDAVAAVHYANLALKAQDKP